VPSLTCCVITHSRFSPRLQRGKRLAQEYSYVDIAENTLRNDLRTQNDPNVELTGCQNSRKPSTITHVISIE